MDIENEGDHFLSCEIEEMFHADTMGVLKSIISCMYCGVVMAKSGKNGFIVWNQKAKDILGKGAEEISIEHWAPFYGCFHSNMKTLYNAEELPLVRALKGEYLVDVEMYVKNEQQPGIWISINASPIRINDEIIGGVIVFKDISREKLLEKQFLSLLDQLEDLKQEQVNVLLTLSKVGNEE